MGQDVKDSSRICPLPPGPLTIGLSTNTDRREIIVAVSLIAFLSIAALSTYIFWVPPPPPPLSIAIDGDADFSDTALLEGWPGDGTPEDPYIIDGLELEVARGHVISISNTRVSFTISNCDLIGGNNGPRVRGAGIYLENVTNGELVNNIFSCNENGIVLNGSSSNTVFNNTCHETGIVLDYSDYNTVANNTCDNKHGVGINLRFSDYNTVANNNCSSHDIGICLESSNSNTVVNNTCNNNRIGIYLDDASDNNIVANNTFVGNTEHDILGEYMTEATEPEGSGPEVLLFIRFAGIIMLGAAWKLLSGIREFN